MGLETVFPDFARLEAEGFPGIACRKPTVMIATTERAGSTHLCASMHAAGLPFTPIEIFNPRGPAQQGAAQHGVTTFASYIPGLASTPGDLFIFKASWLDFAPLATTACDLFPRLRVVYLDRRNIAAQAVSLYRAMTENVWHRRTAQPSQAREPPGDFDLERAMSLLDRLEADKRAWEKWFAAAKIAPVRLTYESFETDISVALRRLNDAFGLALASDIGTDSGFVRLADATSADWTLRVQKRLLNMT